ncbi:MAG: hypothetical protein BWY71_02042 [Planctomycetes bacterium ADurb.Bin412]|nr:MAG: hypothetical protein BWY71_02042 [Planctomycetes bacterium ADurb.Bin412]
MPVLYRIVDDLANMLQVLIRSLPDFRQHGCLPGDFFEIFRNRNRSRITCNKNTGVRYIYTIMSKQVLDCHTEGRLRHLKPQYRPIRLVGPGDTGLDLEAKGIHAVPDGMTGGFLRQIPEYAVINLDGGRLRRTGRGGFDADSYRLPLRMAKGGNLFQLDGLLQPRKYPADFWSTILCFLFTKTPCQPVLLVLRRNFDGLPFPLPGGFSGPILQFNCFLRRPVNGIGKL